MNDTLHGDECEILRELRRSDRIFQLLRESTEPELRLQTLLRQEFSDEVVRAAMTLHELRKKGATKFSRASEMWFDRQGLEQSTSEVVARHKAGRFDGQVWDYCCGIGADAIAMAEHCDVLAIDRSEKACLQANWNSEVYDVHARLQTVFTDVEALTARNGLVHVDPDRRAGKRGRALRVEDGVPGLPFLVRLIAEFAGGAIKLSPASNFAGKFLESEIELISVAGECKEATVWFGSLADEGQWRATVLPVGATLVGHPLAVIAEVGELGRYLYDPDPAVVRAGLIDVLAEQSQMRRLDDAEEYLTSDELVESPFVRALEVVAELPNNDREIRRYFREADFGQLEIKCRHIPIQAEAVRRKLSLNGQQPGVLVFARILGKARAVVCRRIARAESQA